MAKIESLPLNVVWNLTKQTLMVACGTTDVEIVGVGYAYEYEDGCELDEYPLLVNALINGINGEDGGLHPWLMVWDEKTCDFYHTMRLDQKGNNNNKGKN